MIKPIKKAVISVAGVGTRMLPATKAIPKGAIARQNIFLLPQKWLTHMSSFTMDQGLIIGCQALIRR